MVVPNSGQASIRAARVTCGAVFGEMLILQDPLDGKPEDTCSEEETLPK